MTTDSTLKLWVDSVIALDDQSFYVRGWTRASDAGVTRLTAVSPEGQRLELIDKAIRYPRPDVDAHFAATDVHGVHEGFSCFVEAPDSGVQTRGWTFEVEDADGDTDDHPAPAIMRDPEAARQLILNDLLHNLPRDEDDLLSNHSFPALRIMAETHWGSPTLDRVVQYGSLPVDPTVSIIVPVYRELDLVELQLAIFADDPDLDNADLIYVLDSPEDGPALIDRCHELFELYRQPFRVAVLQEHSGYSGANNAGASLSKGRLLLLLNSDVIPRDRGWLSTMTRLYDETPSIGALGPKLLYEDDSLQHAGMYFEELVGKSLWTNAHYFKGMHRTLPAANTARAVPAVTGACLLIERDLYFDHQGLLGLYMQGDFEDSDLCLRLWRAGRENWYFPEVELYHLEGQSYDLATRQRNNRYNCWLHTKLRGDTIAEVMEQFAGTTPAVTRSD